MRNVSKIAAALLFGLSINHGLYAQTGGGETKSSQATKEVSVDWLKAYLDLVSITANRSEVDLPKYPGQIGILGEKDLNSTPSIIETLGMIPGVSIGNDLDRQIAQSYNIRGFGYQSENRVIIEQDGIKRSPSLFSNHISSFRVDNDLLKRVEVVKGASSVLRGSGAIGGIVSMQTKGVKDFIADGNSFGLMLGHRQESNHMNSNRAAIAAKPVENLGVLLYGKHADYGNTKFADGGRGGQVHAIDDERINTLFGKIEWDVAEGHKLDLSLFNYHENLLTGWQSLWHQPGEYPVVGRLKQRDFSTLYRFSPANNPWVDFSAQYHNSYAKYHRVYASPTAVSDYANEEKRWGLSLKNESQFDTAAIEHRLVVGFDHDVRKEDALFLRNGEPADFGSLPNFYKDYGLYVQDVMNVGKLEFTLGGRYDYFKRGVDLPGRETYSESRFSPKIGMAYELFEGVNLLAGYAETFRGPTPNETSAEGALNPHYYYLPNTALQPEIAKEIEIGFSINKKNLLADDQLYLKATHYRGNIEDMINLESHPEMGETPKVDEHYKRRVFARYENVDNAKRYGYELEAKYNINQWDFAMAYDHMKIYNRANNKRIGAYADKLVLGAQYAFTPWNLSAGATMTHWFAPKRDSKSFKQRGQTYYYVDDSFRIVNFKGTWAPKRFKNQLFASDLKVNFGINNLFDDIYINAARTTDTTLVGKGRNFYLDVEMKF